MAPFRLLNPLYAERKRLPKVLLYSGAVHLAVFYLLVGDPFSIFAREKNGPLESKELRVHLLSPSQGKEALGRDGEKEDFPVFPRDEKGELSDPGESGAQEERKEKEDRIDLVASAPPASTPAPQAAERKMPRNMTGPQDCMLKVVAMVCPDADLQCLAEYKAFCSALPN